MSQNKTPRIAIVASNYWPERTGIGQVTTEFAEFLARAGIVVSVATAAPYYPEWSIYSDYRGKLWQTQTHNGVTIYRAAHYAAPTPTAVGRILHEMTLCLMSLPNILRAIRKSNTAFVVSPDLSHAFVACIVARVMGVPVILYVQDIMPDAAVEMGMLRSKFVIQVSRMLAKANYLMAERIYTLSEGMKNRIARSTTKADKIEIVPNTVDPDEFTFGSDIGKSFRERFAPEHRFVVIHSGNMGEKQDLDLLLRCARRLLHRPEVLFLVFGDGAVKDEFLAKRDSLRLTNVSHFPLQDRALLGDMLVGADICLVTQAASVTDVVVPSKLVTSMGAGAMIVAACAANSETSRLLAESGGGLCVPAGDDRSLAALITRICDGEIATQPYRSRAREFARNRFSKSTVYGRITRQLCSK